MAHGHSVRLLSLQERYTIPFCYYEIGEILYFKNRVPEAVVAFNNVTAFRGNYDVRIVRARTATRRGDACALMPSAPPTHTHSPSSCGAHGAQQFSDVLRNRIRLCIAHINKEAAERAKAVV